MDIVVGSVVRAKAGRDRNGYLVVVGLDGGFAYIADGRSRKVEKPKKKNLIHLEPTRCILNVGTASNREVKKLLNQFKGI